MFSLESITRQRLRRISSRFVPVIVSLVALVACGGAPTLPTEAVSTTTVAATIAPTNTVSPTSTLVPTSTSAPTATSEPTATPEPTATLEPTPEPTATAPAASRAMPRGSLTARPWTIMIDNHPDAVPQSGLNAAAMVFEGLAEFGITRFMATYVAGTQVEQIGPIRSTRLYFAQLAMGTHSIYGHAGGSPDGQELVRTTTELINFDADGSAASFRDQTRAAPHNLYTTSALLQTLSEGFPLDIEGMANVGYVYDATIPAGQPIGAIGYFFADSSSRASWSWDSGCGCYLRSQRDQAHTDRLTGAQLNTKNIVLMEVTGGLRDGDDKSRIDQYVVGGGRARIFRDGVMIEASWAKESEAGPLRFVNGDGAEIPFAPGALWIAGVPSFDNVTME